MKVEELTRFGKPLTGLPKEVQGKQAGIVFREILRKFGPLGTLPFFIRLFREERALIKRYPDAYRTARYVGEQAAKEVPMLIAMFNIVAEKEGRDRAYAFVQGIFQRVAVHSMPALYQVDDLERCEGDAFDNFARFNIAFFGAMDEAGTWKVGETRREPDKLTIIVTECANCVLGEAFDCPEIARLGCDHDLAGYPVILDRVDAEFRRPHTLAKGDDFCDFMFYRKGAAPDTERLNK